MWLCLSQKPTSIIAGCCHGLLSRSCLTREELIADFDHDMEVIPEKQVCWDSIRCRGMLPTRGGGTVAIELLKAPHGRIA
jgi:hypothetical protein